MASYEQVTYNSPDGAIIAQGPLEKIAFYGAVPVVQRPYSSAVHATSAQATSASFGATQLATIQEIQNTLIGLGVWATS
jgi:hypothetical protein